MNKLMIKNLKIKKISNHKMFTNQSERAFKKFKYIHKRLKHKLNSVQINLKSYLMDNDMNI